MTLRQGEFLFRSIVFVGIGRNAVLEIRINELLALPEWVDAESIGQGALDASVQPNRKDLKLLLAEVLPQEGSILYVLLPEQLA